jgi:nitrogen regulatory protein PII
MAYSARTIVISIVDENKVEEAISSIKQAASTGTASGGIVVVSSIEDLRVI